MVLFRNRFDGLHHIGETSTTLTAFAERMVDFSGHDELPAVLIEERQDGVLDFLLADIVAMTDDHCGSPNQAKTHTGDRLRASSTGPMIAEAAVPIARATSMII